MFREVRRKKREISVDDAKKLLTDERRGVLAVNGDDNYPYALPINYYFDSNDNKIYFHGSKVGYKVEALEKCDKVCFTVTGHISIKDEEWAPYVQSAIVFGRCKPISNLDLANEKLIQFAMKYFPNKDLVDEEILRSGKAVQMYEIEIEHITGKEIQER